ncbi:MAG: secondary thiamine-phosphate synthase enzyme YjbQ [Nanoarchaeota archaeon]
MQIDVHKLEIRSRKKFQIIDITKRVLSYLKRRRVHTGEITVTTKHTTTAVRINEYEPLLRKDMEAYISNLAPKNVNYLHDDIKKRKNCPPNERKNAHAHLKALLMGASETLPIKDGRLDLGKWQKILFIELDGPRKRQVNLELVAD